MRHHTLTTIDVDGIEVELDSNPEYFDPITRQPTPDTLVVGYLLYDQDCGNPMRENDCEGSLYTNPSYYAADSSITDDKSAPCKLGLNSFSGRNRHEMDYDLELDGIEEKVAEHLRAKIQADEGLRIWMVSCTLLHGAPFEQIVDDVVTVIKDGEQYAKFDWDEENVEIIDGLGKYENLAKTAWEDLYSEGKIGDYLAVPVYYAASVHGPGTTQMYTTSLGSANAAWVPCKCAIENIRTQALPKGAEIKWEGSIGVGHSTLHAVAKIDGQIVADCKTWKEALDTVTGILGEIKHADLMRAAEKYAQGVLKEYESWCNGDCWGYVVESFVLEDGEYVRSGEPDSCWGFIGQEWAEESLKEQMGYAEDRLKEREAA